MRPYVTAAFLALVAFLCSVAYAADGPVTVDNIGAYWAQFVILVCMGASYCARKYAPQGHFFHTDFGALALNAFVLVCSGIAAGVQAHGLSVGAILQSVLATAVNAGMLSNPSVPSGTTAPMAMKKQVGSIRTEILAALAIVGLIACGGAQVWKTCELGKLPQIAQTVIPTVVQDLGGVDQSTAIAQVETAGIGLLPGQISCVVQAIIADVEAKAAKIKGQLSPVQENIVNNGKAFLKVHPAVACGEPPPIIHAAIEIATDRSMLADAPRGTL